MQGEDGEGTIMEVNESSSCHHLVGNKLPGEERGHEGNLSSEWSRGTLKSYKDVTRLSAQCWEHQFRTSEVSICEDWSALVLESYK